MTPDQTTPEESQAPRPGQSSDLPETGDDPSQFEEEPVQESTDRPEDADTGEERDEPNDLSHIDKEFDDDES
jgi:hypothetical protein